MKETTREEEGLRRGKQREGKGERLPQQKYFIPKRFLNAAMSVTQSWGQAIVLSCGFCRKADVRHESCSSYSFQLKTCICICKVYSTHTISTIIRIKWEVCCVAVCNVTVFTLSGSAAYSCCPSKDVTDVFWSVLFCCSHFFLSVCTSSILWLCVYVCVSVCLLWSGALAQKGRPGHPILCFASCRKLAANCGSMRHCCFV